MNLGDFRAFLTDSFGKLLEMFEENDEYGFNHPIPQQFTRIGYATNLTPEVVKKAAKEQVQLIITHHDAWEFVYGMKAECIRLLQEYDITHFYVHLPLDFAEFGTCNSLFKEIGITNIIQQTQYIDDKEIVGIGRYDTPIAFDELAARVSERLGERVKAWKNSDAVIERVGIITGAGNSTALMNQALDAGCDAYITGEKTLYSVQYAQFAGLNLIVGSHTFTEIFGVRSLVEKLNDHYPTLEIVQIQEEHIE